MDKEEKRNRIEEHMSSVILFPGSKNEFEEFIGYPVRIINTQKNDKGVDFEAVLCGSEIKVTCVESMNVKELLYNKNIIALVRVQVNMTNWGLVRNCYYGLPVAKIEGPYLNPSEV